MTNNAGDGNPRGTPVRKLYKPPSEVQADTSLLRRIKGVAIGIFAALAAAPVLIPELRQIFLGPFSMENGGKLLLYFATSVLVFMWWWSTENELNKLEEWLDWDTYVPPQGTREAVMIGMIALFAAALFWTVKTFELYSGLYAAYTVVNLIASSHMIRQLHVAISERREHILETRQDTSSDRPSDSQLDAYEAGVQALENHYFKDPQFARFWLNIIVGWIIFIIALLRIAIFNQMPVWILYLCLSALIIGSEIWIAAWRFRLDDSLNHAAILLKKAGHTPASHIT
jgi:hypothetical protein